MLLHTRESHGVGVSDLAAFSSTLLRLHKPGPEQAGMCSGSRRGPASGGARTTVLLIACSSPWARPCSLAHGSPLARRMASSQMQEMRRMQRPESTKPLSPHGCFDSCTHTGSFICHCHCAGSRARCSSTKTRPFPALEDLPALWLLCVGPFGPGPPASSGSVFSENRL